MRIMKALVAIISIVAAGAVMLLLLMRNARYSGEPMLSWDNVVDSLPTLGLMSLAILLVAVFYRGR